MQVLYREIQSPRFEVRTELVTRACEARGGGNDTPCLRVPAVRIFKELPCFGVKFLNIHPASENDFLSGIFSGESIVMQISFVMIIFLLFSEQFFWGRGKFPGQIA